MLALACGSLGSSIPPTTTHTYPVALNYVLATNILEVGEQRVSFLLSTPNGILKTSSAMVTPVYLEGDGPAYSTIEAQFNLWPYGIRGSYTAYANFDRPGRWRLDLQVDNPNGVDEIQINLNVLDKSPVPSVASKALLSETKTLARYGPIELITTDYSPDPDLYRLSVHEAVQISRPSMIVFASPAFCTSPTCGPQVGELTKVKETLGGQANFIHVEVYEDPHLIEGDRPTMTLIPAVAEWNLPTEPWTFIVDKNGLISAKFEQFTTADEIKAKLLEIL